MRRRQTYEGQSNDRFDASHDDSSVLLCLKPGYFKDCNIWSLAQAGTLVLLMVPASILAHEVGTGLGIHLSATRAPELSSTELPASTAASTPASLPHSRNLPDLYALFDPGGLQIIVPKPKPTDSIPHSLTVVLCPRSARLHDVPQQLRQ